MEKKILDHTQRVRRKRLIVVANGGGDAVTDGAFDGAGAAVLLPCWHVASCCEDYFETRINRRFSELEAKNPHGHGIA
jgi:hypothetical protein